MAIKTQYDTLDEIPEQYRDLYKEVEGKYVLTEVIGIKTQADVDRIQEGLRKERADHTALKQKYSFLNGLDIEEVQTKLDKYDELEASASGASTDEKVQKLVDAKINTIKGPLERQINKLTDELNAANGQVKTFQERETERKITDAVTQAARKLKVQDTAIEDAMLTGRAHLTVDEDGNVVTKDGTGMAAGLNAEVWLTELQGKRPHWWGESSGGGAGGGRGNVGANNPWSKEHWNMTEQGRMYRENPAKAEQMAKAAGVAIGATGPKA